MRSLESDFVALLVPGGSEQGRLSDARLDQERNRAVHSGQRGITNAAFLKGLGELSHVKMPVVVEDCTNNRFAHRGHPQLAVMQDLLQVLQGTVNAFTLGAAIFGAQMHAEVSPARAGASSHGSRMPV